MIKSFKDMDVWKVSNRLSVDVFRMTNSLPTKEDYALTSQIRRSANSVSANIAEGFGRKTKKDKSFFYTIARGSSFETQSHLLYGKEVGYFVEAWTDRMLNEYDDLILQLNKITKSLKD